MNGWASIYETHEVTDYDGPGTLIQYQRPSSGCLGYLLYDGGEAAIVDPLRAFTDRYLADAEELGVELTYAFDTHVHADHISGLRNLADEGVEAMLRPPPPTAASPTPTMSRSSRTATSSPWATRPSRPCSRPDTRPG